MPDVSLNAIVGGSVVVKKSIVINSSQNWTAPVNLAGNTVWITGCAGGGSGAAGSGGGTGGYGGAYCEKSPVIVAPSSTNLVTIGAGGAGVTNNNGNAGGNTSFGSLLTLRGGSGGQHFIISGSTTISNLVEYLLSGFGIRPTKGMITGAASSAPIYSGSVMADTVNGNVCGQSTLTGTGGACGLFGSGTDASAGASAAAAVNSGAGSGYGSTGSGTGGSGKMIIEWDEFL
jgi:hypothetical protein